MSMADCSKPKPDLRMNSRGGKRCWFKEVPALGVSVTLNSGAQTVGRDRSVGGPRGTSGPEKHQVINICLKTEKGSTVLMDKQDRF